MPITTGPHALTDQSPERLPPKDLSSDPTTTRLRRAAIFQLEGDRSQARAIYEEILQEQPEHAAALNNLALLYQHAGQPDVAIEMFDRLAAVGELSPIAQTNRANAYIEHGDVTTGIPMLEGVVSRSPESVAWVSLGKARLLVGDVVAARTALEIAVEQFPGRGEVWRLLGASAATMGDLDAAINAFEVAIGNDPADASAWRQLSMALLSRNDLGSGLVAARRSAELAPTMAAARRQLAMAMLANRLLKEAAVELEAALDLHESTEVAIDLAVVYLTVGEARTALPMLKKLAIAEPDNERAAINLAYAHLACGHESTARKVLVRLVRQNGARATEAGNMVSQLDGSA